MYSFVAKLICGMAPNAIGWKQRTHIRQKKPAVLLLLCCPKIDQRVATNLEKTPQIQQAQVRGHQSTHILQ